MVQEIADKAWQAEARTEETKSFIRQLKPNKERQMVRLSYSQFMGMWQIPEDYKPEQHQEFNTKLS